MSELVSLNANITFDHASLGTAKADRQEAERVVRAVQFLNRTEFSPQSLSSTNLSFAYDEAAQRTIVTVVDRTTGDVLSQMPAKEVLRIAAEIRKRQSQAENGGFGQKGMA
jgi:uncharacterized FlaG/YvyC family protein